MCYSEARGQVFSALAYNSKGRGFESRCGLLMVEVFSGFFSTINVGCNVVMLGAGPRKNNQPPTGFPDLT
jgi:hypothetical protein